MSRGTQLLRHPRSVPPRHLLLGLRTLRIFEEGPRRKQRPVPSSNGHASLKVNGYCSFLGLMKSNSCKGSWGLSRIGPTPLLLALGKAKVQE